MFFGMIFANIAFLTETISQKRIKRNVGYAISVVFALTFTYINVNADVIKNIVSNSLQYDISFCFVNIF